MVVVTANSNKATTTNRERCIRITLFDSSLPSLTPLISSRGLSYDPGCHTALILNHRGLDWIDEPAAEAVRHVQQHSLVDEISLGPVGQCIASSTKRTHPVFHADG